MYLFHCTIASLQERTSPCEFVSGSSWQPCPDIEELLQVLSSSEANPSGAVVLRPSRTMNLTSLHASVCLCFGGSLGDHGPQPEALNS